MKTLFSFPDFERKLLGRSQKIFGCDLKSALFVWRRTSLRSFSWVLRTYFVDVELLAKSFRRVCDNCFLWDRRIVLKEKSSFKERSCFPIVFGIRGRHFWTFGSKLFGWLVKTAFYVSIETFFFWRKYFLENFIAFSNHIPILNWNIFHCFRKKSRLGCQFRLRLAQKNLMRKKML